MKLLRRLYKIPRNMMTILPVLTRNQLRRYAPAILFYPLDSILRFFLRHINSKSIRFVPIVMSALLTNYALEANKFDLAFTLTKRAQMHPKSRRLAFNYEIQIAESKSDESRDDQLSLAISEKGIMEGRFGAALLWSFWNLSLLEYADFIKKVLIRLEERETNWPPSGPRLLPEFSTNMGHLGYLVSYLGYYENQDPAREIVLWPDQSPNSFYMSLVINQSPIKIITRSGKSNLTFEDPNMMDSLIFSRKSTGEWRFEHNAAVCSNQIFPELSGTGNFKLSFPKDSENECITQLKKMGFKPDKWFVILHIRESARNNLDSTQARDSEVNKFIDFCNLISDLGGQVVRMGGRNFPKLTPNFQAIDYAHSEFSSDMIDCWLWANCRWWTGNANGASLAAHAFGASRLFVDQWFWDNFGPSTDLYLPKIVLRNRVPLNAIDTINHKLSRNMNVKVLKQNSLSFRSNTSQEIVNATLDMYNQLNSTQVVKPSQLSEVDVTLSKLLRNVDPVQTMRVAPSFRAILSNLAQ